jgi:hypothetical protein
MAVFWAISSHLFGGSNGMEVLLEFPGIGVQDENLCPSYPPVVKEAELGYLLHSPLVSRSVAIDSRQRSFRKRRLFFQQASKYFSIAAVHEARGPTPCIPH